MISTIDLFCGCGGLLEGFEASGYYTTKACVEWEKSPCDNLKKHLLEKWGYKNNVVLRFDIQRTEELFLGWHDDPEYGSSKGLDYYVKPFGLDLLIGGPPCQAYSIAGRVRDENGMRNDYRNFLFESYIKVVERYSPKAFIFENVPGILTAKPTGRPIIDIIKESFDKTGYAVIDDLHNALVDFSEYGVPQKRNRIIILGLNKKYYGDKTKSLLNNFYKAVLPSYKVVNKTTVRDAIADLPILTPLKEPIKSEKKLVSHSFSVPFVDNHEPRFHNSRDISIFRMLESDIERGENKYISTEALKQVYKKATGKDSNVHKYYVLRWNEQSNLIPAHLFKDGLRHIHPDSNQARSITVREAARLQGFPDDYLFIGTQADKYKMIGNAVPPVFSEKLANAIYELLFQE